MSARDEAIEALELWLQPAIWLRADNDEPLTRRHLGAMLDAAHASGAIVYADELEQIGKADSEPGMDRVRWRFTDAQMPLEGRQEPVFRKRPQEPNE